MRDQVLDKLSFTFEDLGAQQVKNIARPVDVYRVELGSGGPRAQGPGFKPLRRLAQRKRWQWPAAGVLALGLAGMGIWLLPRLFHHAPPPSPPSGSLAVLPFNPATASAADGQLADALTADLTSALQRGMQWAPVVSPNLALTYKGKGFDARALGRELNIRYVVEGEVRTVGDQVVVKARLTETGNGTEVWSGDVGLEQARIAKERSDLVARLTVQVNNALLNVERRRILAQPLANASATDLALRADAIQQIDAVGSLTTMAEARKLYDAALRLDPNMPAALMGQALTVAGRLDLDPRTNRDALVREYEEMSARLVAVAGGEARAWNIRADALQRAWRWEAALEANARAQSMDPTRSGSNGQRADIMNAMGRHVEALALVELGLSLQSPDAGIAGYLIGSRCHASMALGRYEDAVVACEREASPADSWTPHAHLVAAYAHLGNDAKTQAEKTKLLTQRPGFSIADFKAFRTSDVPAYLQQTETHLFSGLRKAGIKEN